MGGGVTSPPYVTLWPYAGHSIVYFLQKLTFPPAIEWPRHEAGHSPPSCTEVKNCGSVPPVPYLFPFCSV
jgi:hypothetical protein